MFKPPDLDAMYRDAAKSAKIDRCHVLCRKCGATQFIDGAKALREGWPKCCGETMMLGACTEKKSNQ